MKNNFLTAEWRNLLMANYSINAAVLKPYLPCYTELDEYNGVHYVSLVGFLFTNTIVGGISFPFHTTFEEVNLRFYVRYKEAGLWKRGVVFMKEIVPQRMITFVANTVYKEKYATHPMKHVWETSGDDLKVEYYWKVGRNWNFLKAVANKVPSPLVAGSEEEFITEHYWGYTHVNKICTGVYEVAHPQWNIHAVKSFDVACSTAELYGPQFVDALAAPPRSVFLAEGSPISVLKGGRIYS
ncbi:MAG: YqjF family protein [Chitinophagaceae bacterium]